MTNREKVTKGLECCAFGDCGPCPYTETRCQEHLCGDAIDLLREQEARVLEYSEIEKHPLVWLEDNDKEDVIPALFLQYNGWSAEFSRQAPDKYVDTIVRSAEVIADERKYGVTWRAWSARPSSDQMRDTKWEEK